MFSFDSYPCAIPYRERGEVIITGGAYSETTVAVYNEEGWQRFLSSLNQGRWRHACSSYLNQGERVILIVCPYRELGYLSL